jgi:hypothetical protein
MAKIDEDIRDPIAAAIDAHHARAKRQPRAHLGASLLGHPCKRWLWLSFRWAVIEQFEGRMLRLFRRGNLEEAQVIADLRAIGCKIDVTQGKVDFGSHVSGSCDGIIESGVPGAEKSRHVLEIKTHSKKSFDDLARNGVERSKPQHYVQLQVYMHGLGIDRGLYAAVCKDDDRYHFERVHYRAEVAEVAVDAARQIALDPRPPARISADPTWYQCRFCPGRSICHEAKPTREVNCRTCAHSTARGDSTWFCERWQATIPYAAQVTGCDSHALHPDLVPWDLERSDGDDFDAYYRIAGDLVRNGEGGVPSRELVKRYAP